MYNFLQESNLMKNGVIFFHPQPCLRRIYKYEMVIVQRLSELSRKSLIGCHGDEQCGHGNDKHLVFIIAIPAALEGTWCLTLRAGQHISNLETGGALRKGRDSQIENREASNRQENNQILDIARSLACFHLLV